MFCLQVVEIDDFTAEVEDTGSESCTRNETDEALWPSYDAGHIEGCGETSLLSIHCRALSDDMKIPYMAKVWEPDVCGVVSWGGCCHAGGRIGPSQLHPLTDVLSFDVSNAFASVAKEKKSILEHASKLFCYWRRYRHAGQLHESALRIDEARRRVSDLVIALRRARLANFQQDVIRGSGPGCGGAFRKRCQRRARRHGHARRIGRRSQSR